MSQYQHIGNPVDTWWTNVRNEIDQCIDLLGQFPPAPNSNSAAEMISAVKRAQMIVKAMDYPAPASKMRGFLLESLLYLGQSLKEQAIHGLSMSDISHNIAYHKFLMVTYLLLQRGIYEPEPTSLARRQVS